MRNDRLIWDGPFLVDEHSTSVNIMMNIEDEPILTYGTAWIRHLKRIWNMRITYPTTDLLFFDDDVKGVFRHCKYYPDVLSAFTYTFSNRLYFPLRGTFGSTTSPANFEPLYRARTHLAQRLSRNRMLIAKHKAIIDKVKYCEPPDTTQLYVQATTDAINNGIEDERGDSHTTYNMFVDNSIYCEIRSLMPQSMAASIETLFFIFGVDDLTARGTYLSMDTYFQTV